jgi:hypothetical protein
MTILNPLAPPTAQGHPNGESPAVGEPADGPSVARSDDTGELSGRIRLYARWTADVRPTATWCVESRPTR